MLDRYSQELINPTLQVWAVILLRYGFTPNMISSVGIEFAIFSALAIYLSFIIVGLLFIYLNRLCDGLDGVMARQTEVTPYGGFIDITFDFFFYAIIPLSFGLLNQENLLPSMLLLASFLLNGSSFLAYASIKGVYSKTEKTVKKSIYYSSGLIEGTETIFFFTMFCLLPDKFPLLSYIFASLTLITFVQRVYLVKKEFNP